MRKTDEHLLPKGDEMNTIKDFKNAPVGATATNEASGNRALKTVDRTLPWTNSQDNYLTHVNMADEGYTLDQPAPTTVREALDLAWELAHEVKEGQVIPKGARYLEYYSSGLEEYTAGCDFKITPALAPLVRTVEPLPDPEPEWLDAPAVIAHVDAPNVQPTSVFVPTGTHPDRWARFDSEWTFHWNELRNVIPLYPKEGQNS